MFARCAIRTSVIRLTFRSTRHTALSPRIPDLYRDTVYTISRSKTTTASHVGESKSPVQVQDPTTVGHDPSSAVLEDITLVRDINLPSLPRHISYSYISKDNFKTYFRPLYLRGWGIYISSSIAPSLRKTFRFPTDKTLLEFVAELGKSIVEVQHHPTVQFSYTTLDLSTQTHEARICIPTGPEAGSKIYVQGLTLKDVQMAYLAEENYEASCKANGYEYEHRGSKLYTPLSLESLMQEWAGVIYAAGGNNARTRATKETKDNHDLTMRCLGIARSPDCPGRQHHD